eukprot:2719123-Rhodomonas_salina.3
MPGTDLASGGICLRACYAMPGTDLGYGTTPANPVLGTAHAYGASICLRFGYGSSGTNLAYSTMTSAVLATRVTERISRPSAYAMSGMALQAEITGGGDHLIFRFDKTDHVRYMLLRDVRYCPSVSVRCPVLTRCGTEIVSVGGHAVPTWGMLLCDGA